MFGNAVWRIWENAATYRQPKLRHAEARKNWNFIPADRMAWLVRNVPIETGQWRPGNRSAIWPSLPYSEKLSCMVPSTWSSSWTLLQRCCEFCMRFLKGIYDDLIQENKLAISQCQIVVWLRYGLQISLLCVMSFKCQYMYSRILKDVLSCTKCLPLALMRS